jgi:hypothetical protein
MSETGLMHATATRRYTGWPRAALEAEHTRLAVAKKAVEQTNVETRDALVALKRRRREGPVPESQWRAAHDACQRAKRAAVEIDMALAALRPLLRHARVTADDRRRDTRAQAFVAMAKLHLPPETFRALWDLVDASAGRARGLPDDGA